MLHRTIMVIAFVLVGGTLVALGKDAAGLSLITAAAAAFPTITGSKAPTETSGPHKLPKEK